MMGETQEKKEAEREEIKETGTLDLHQNPDRHRIQLMTIIGEIEGHEAVSGNTKATKYEHLLPRLAEAEDSEEVEGVLILLNTLGGDVEAGLAIAGTFGGIGGLFLYRAKRDYDRPSGAFQRHVHRGLSELPEYGKDPGPDHRIYRGAFPDQPEKTGGADAGSDPACEGRRHHVRRGGRGPGGPDR